MTRRKIKVGGKWVKTPEYRAWSHMKERCSNPNVEHYHRYGGRGITVNKLWINNFDAFLEYVGPRPSTKHSIDRIDNDGNYEPGNVRWADKFTQASNKAVRSNNSTGFTGVRFNKRCGRYASDFSFKNKRYFFGYFDTAEEASIMREIGIKRLREDRI